MKNPIRQTTAWLGRQATRFQQLMGAKPPRATDPLANWIRPSAGDRWLAPSVRWYTPEMVEHITREAMAGDLQRQWELFDLMEATWPRLQGNLKKLKEKVVGLDWRVEPYKMRGEKPTEEAQWRADDLEDALEGMRPNNFRDENDFEGMLFDILDAWGKGISVQEIYWERRGNLFCPRATKAVPTRFYGYGDRGMGDELMLRSEALTNQGPSPEGKITWVPFTADKFICAVAKQKSGHPSGSSLLRCLGFFWAAQNFSWEWFLNFAQLFGVPIRWASYAPNSDAGTIAAIKAMLADMGSAGYGAFPAGTALEIIEAVKASAEGPHERLIAQGDKLCDILILGQTLTTDVGASGSRALGDTHADTLSVRERSVARFAERVINAQLVTAWCRMNFGSDHECPHVCLEIEEEEDKKGIADTLEVAQRIGVRIPSAFAHERLDIPEPRDGETVLVAPQKPMAALPGASGQPPEAPDGFPTPPEAPNAPSEAAKAGNGAPESPIQAADGIRDADRKLADAVMESLTGVQAEWLGGARPYFVQLIQAAQSTKISDAEFVRLLEAAAKNVTSELAPLLNTEALAGALDAAMGAAVVNGAVQGWMKRKPKK